MVSPGTTVSIADLQNWNILKSGCDDRVKIDLWLVLAGLGQILISYSQNVANWPLRTRKSCEAPQVCMCQCPRYSCPFMMALGMGLDLERDIPFH